jgi:hypothetical protein
MDSDKPLVVLGQGSSRRELYEDDVHCGAPYGLALSLFAGWGFLVGMVVGVLVF